MDVQADAYIHPTSGSLSLSGHVGEFWDSCRLYLMSNLQQNGNTFIPGMRIILNGFFVQYFNHSYIYNETH